MKKIKISSFIVIVLFFSVFFSNKASALEKASFHISQLKDGVFQEVFSKSFPVKYATSTFSFNNLSDSLTLEISERGDLLYSGVDSVILNACGQTLEPISAVFEDNNQNILDDISKTDLNVVVTHNRPMRISWNLPHGCSDANLSLNANEYTDGLPVRFPVNGLKKKTADYVIGSNQGSLKIDGDLSETDGTNPLYKMFWKPDTGHPDGYTYLYARDDSNYLYFAADITADNTDDIGPDWISITIGDKEFKVTDADQTYGKCGFGLTSKVAYKHAKCELKIPKSEIAYYSGTVPFVLQYYGTLAISVTTLGDGSEDVTIPADSDATIEFNAYGGPGFSDTTKAAIERDISDAADHTLTYSWDGTGLILTIHGNATYNTTFLTDVRSPYLESSLGSPYAYPGNLSLIDSTPDGSAEHPFKVSTCRQLQNINYNLSSNYILTSDIDCSKTNPSDLGFDATDIWGDSAGFSPIGLNQGPDYFYGNLDGQNYIVSNLFINRPSTTFVGLFSKIDTGSSVQNIGLADVDITGGDRTGALVGALSGTVTNTYSTGTVHGDWGTGGLVGTHVNDNSWYNSSPLVYTWNGSKYKYVADVGNLLPKEATNSSDAATIDKGDLVSTGDKYSMKISEEYNEIVYYDKLALYTYDHAPGYSIAIPLNRTATVSDARTVSDTPTNPLLSCSDNHGNDCLANLKDNDDKWAVQDPSFVNYYTLDFGDLSNKDNIELVMRGARDYDASAKLRAKGTYQSVRTIQVKNSSGNWVEIYNKNDLGSDGTPRLRTIDLTGKFLTNDYHVRVGFDTMYMNYFAVDTSPQVPVTVHSYSPTKADLSFRGFTDMSNDPYVDHDYSKVSPLPKDIFKAQYGNFTKYGDVSPLLQTSNNQFVIMHPGDHMDIEFPYEAPREGMERSFVLDNDAWYKHASNEGIDLLGKTVTPLPYQGMTSYTSETNGYPMTAENVAYLNTWNTRIYKGTPLPDRAAGSTIIDSYSNATVFGQDHVGGLVGYNEKEIRRSYATGDVTASNWVVGGLVGENMNSGSQGWIHDSYARGNVTGGGNVGGLVGNSYGGIVERSYSTGLITANYNSDYGHGLIGNDCPWCAYGSGYTSDAFWDKETSGKDNGGAGTGKTTTEMTDIYTFTNRDTDGLTNAWDFTGTENNDAGTDDYWRIDPSVNEGYPYLSWQISVPAPVISNIQVSPASTTATITWDTDATSSSKIIYSVSGSNYVSTPETDSSPRVQSHSKELSDLLPCTAYYYKVYSAGGYHNITTTASSTFMTLGCAGETTSIEKTLRVVTTSADATTTLNLNEDSKYFTVSTPSNFTSTSSSVVIQIKSLDKDTVLGSIGKPGSFSGVGSIVFDVKALINATTTLDSFDAPVTITYHYSDSDIAGLDETSLVLYHYHNGAWSVLDNCTVDTSANTITCTAPNFSVFALFGQPNPVSNPTVSSSGGGGGAGGGTTYGCKDPKATNYKSWVANDPALCKYATTVVLTTATTTTNPFVIKTATTSKVIFSRELNVGMSGPDVLALQKILIAKKTGKMAQKLAQNTATGFFGPLTKSALIEFQKVNKILPATGNFGPRTKALISGL